MKRPERYPYTRSQWVEETADYYTYEDGIYFTSHVLKNRLTREIKSKELSDGRQCLVRLDCRGYGN